MQALWGRALAEARRFSRSAVFANENVFKVVPIVHESKWLWNNNSMHADMWPAAISDS